MEGVCILGKSQECSREGKADVHKWHFVGVVLLVLVVLKGEINVKSSDLIVYSRWK